MRNRHCSDRGFHSVVPCDQRGQEAADPKAGDGCNSSSQHCDDSDGDLEQHALRAEYPASNFYLFCGCRAVPSLISSVARRTTTSPACRLPITSTRSPSSAPLRTSTHSALPSRSRTTKTRSVVVTTLVFGTN